MAANPVDRNHAQPPPGDVMITTNCWSCGAGLAKVVRRLGRPRHVFWSCQGCEVSWSERAGAK